MKLGLRNIYLIGMNGVGKSTIGKILANHLHWAFVDINQTIEAIYNRPLQEIFDTFGEESFKNMETTILRELSQGEHQVFASNCDSVLDTMKFETMKNSGVTIWLEASPNILIERLKKMKDFPDKDVESFIKQKLEYRNLFFQQADLRLNTDRTSPETITKKIIIALKQMP